MSAHCASAARIAPALAGLLVSTTVVALAEVGDKTQLLSLVLAARPARDKTQIATVALAARYDALASVVLGTTLGMMIANVPVVLLGGRATTRLPMQWIRAAAATVFALLGVLAIVRG